MALGQHHRDRLAAPPRRLPLTAKPPLTTTDPKDSGPRNARPPRRHGRGEHALRPKQPADNGFPGPKPTANHPYEKSRLALCKIHHAAYDANILGIRPDSVIEIHHRLLDEIDGPMLRHGLQQHHGKALMITPTRRSERPDKSRLAFRYERFRTA